MIIKGTVLIYWDDYLATKLKMDVRYKLPKQWFSRKLTKTLENAWWIGIENGYTNEAEFWESCFDILKDRNHLEEIAKNMIINFLKSKHKETESDDRKKKLDELIALANQNFIVEVEYEKRK